MLKQIQTIMAPAKINLFLLVGPVQHDGYHPICSLMAKVGLFDRLTVAGGLGPASVRGGGIAPQENIVFRAIKALEREVGRPLPVAVELEKQIPIAAGLAGGSSDAAAILKQLVDSFDLKITADRLAAVAQSLGADLPFFLQPGMQLAEGIGERLQPVELPFAFHLVLAMPEASIATAQVYRLFDQMADSYPAEFSQRCRRFKDDLGRASNVSKLAALLSNDLEPAALSLCADVNRLKSLLLKSGAEGALMSGSGPSVFGLFSSQDTAREALRELTARRVQAWLAEPLSSSSRD